MDLLIVAQHIHAKSLSGVQMSMGTRPVIDTNQDQYRVQRNRGESVGRHAMDLAILIDGYDRHDSGCETSHSLAEIARINGHTGTRWPLLWLAVFQSTPRQAFST